MKSPMVVRIGLCGLGTVGQGVWKHFERSRAELESRLGVRLELARASVRDLKKKRAVRVAASKLTLDPIEVANDSSVDIVCELMGGTKAARDVTLAALALGKVVVSANKALICDHGAEIFEMARRHGGYFLFEASVAGGIPIIKALGEGLVANRFPLIYGILNGTCNYILTQMSERNAPYAETLAEAKRLGYAEADESLDVEGWDAAQKAAILAYLAHGVWVPTKRMIVEGIDRLTPADFRHAAEFGFGIKLLAIIERDFARNELSVRVHPTLVPRDHVIASVKGVYNAVSVNGDVVGTTLYIGRGAGQDATSSAVISDIADAVTLLKNDRRALGAAARDAVAPEFAGNCRLAPPERIRGRYYLRLTVTDRPGVLARIASALAAQEVSIATVIQTRAERSGAASLVLTTHDSHERAIQTTLSRLAKLPVVLEPPLLLRIAAFPE